MIIVKLTGGLGNQMFQYAMGRNIAFRNKTDFGLDVSWFKDVTTLNTPRAYSLGGFKIKEKFSSIKFRKIRAKLSFLEQYLPCHKRRYFKEKSIFSFDKDSLCLSGNVYLDGYWQHLKYFESIDGIIREEFKLKKELDEDNEIIKTVKRENSVSVHVRRGDYVNDRTTNLFHGVLPSDYYKKAIKLILENIKKPHFIVFSDDIDWAQRNLKFNSPVFFISKNLGFKDYEEIIIMSLCKNHIISNSSFSWWGAWLSNNLRKVVIAPQKWLNEKSIDTSGLFPNSWIKI